MPHSSSDDQRKYRSEKDLKEDLKRDPIKVFENDCLQAKIAKPKEFAKIKNEISLQVDLDAEWAENKFILLPKLLLIIFTVVYPFPQEKEFESISDKIVIVDAINHALSEEMELNEKMVIYGQDIADPKGGVFTATKGLSEKFGTKRVFNSPLAESSIVGTAVGMAVTGYKPVVEIQFGDYIWTAMMQIRNEVVTMRYRSNNNWTCPMVIRVPVGGYIHGALCHSQSIDGYFIHMPGIYIAYPSNASDAKGLLKMACRMNDPVLFMEHKGLYRQGYAATKEPDTDYILPFGKGRLVSKGKYLTLVTWGRWYKNHLKRFKN